MITPYTQQLIDNPPPLGSIQLKTWANTLCSEVLNYLLDPTIKRTNYYVSSNGNLSGTGSQYDPISWAGIVPKLANNTKFLFAAGDEIVVASGINASTYSNIAFEGYGDFATLGKPRIHAFTTRLNQSSGWVSYPVVGPNVYYLSGVFPSKIGWIREYGTDAKRFSPPSYFSTLTGVSGNSRSWTWFANSGGILLVNFGVNPNTLNLEVARRTACDGIIIAGDRSYCKDIEIEGFGLEASDKYNLRSECKDGQINGFIDCNSYFAGRHAIGSIHPSGGITLTKGCLAGYCNNSEAAGTTTYVDYSTNGNHIALLWKTYTVFGQLPDSANIPGSGGTSGGGFYGHTSASQYVSKLVVANECGAYDTGIPGSVPPEGAISFANTPGTVGNLSTYRTYIIDHIAQLNSNQEYGFASCNAYINNRLRMKWTRPNNQEHVIQDNRAVWINPLIEIIDRGEHANAGFTLRSLTYPTVTSGNSFILNGHIQVNCSGIGYFAISVDDTGDAGSGIRMANTIYSNIGVASAYVGTVNSSTNLLNNAFYNIPSGNVTTSFFSNLEPGWGHPSTLSVSLASAPSITGVPTSDSVLYSSGAVAPFGFTLEYDINWNKRDPSRITIGPFQDPYQYQATTVDVVKQAKVGATSKTIRGKIAQGGLNFGTRKILSDNDTYDGLEDRLTDKFTNTDQYT